MSSTESYLDTRQEITSFKNSDNYFEDFHVVDEHKDSDEESFHLQLLSDEEDGNIGKSPIMDDFTTDEKSQDNASSETKDLETKEQTTENQNIKITNKPSETDCNNTATSKKATTEETDINNSDKNEKINENCEIPNKEIDLEIPTLMDETDEQNIGTDDEKNINKEPPVLSKEDSSFEVLTDSAASPPNLSAETEDEILNKFDDLESDPISNDVMESVKEDILLGDVSDKNSSDESNEPNDEIKEKSSTSIPTLKTNVEENNKKDEEDNQKIEEIKSDTNQDSIEKDCENTAETETNKVEGSENDLLDVSFVRDSAEDDADIAEASNMEKESEDSNTGNELDDAASRTSDRRSSNDEMLHTDIEVDSDNQINKENNDDDNMECESNIENELSETEKVISSESADDKESDITNVDKEKDITSVDKEDDVKSINKETDVTNVDKEDDNMSIDKDDDNMSLDKEDDIMDVYNSQVSSDIVEENGLLTQDSNSNGVEETISVDESTKDEENTRTSSNLKRLVEDAVDPIAKKLRLSDKVSTDKVNNDVDYKYLNNLKSFSQYMKNNHLKNLSRRDLEEFCLQKICEVILHKSDLGDLNHVLQVQEQTIEVLRKEQRCMSKQIKDLDIVNKKLMAEVKGYTGQKPLVPVKITRSVGLQVRMMTIAMASETSKRILKNPTQNTPAKSKSPRVQTPISNPQPPPSRQSIPNGRKPTQSPILAQTLQNKNSPAKTVAVNKTPVVQKTKEIQSKSDESSFIDLTDDEETKKTPVRSTATTCVLPQGIRINATGKSPGSVLPVVTSSTPVMYVVQPNQKGSNTPSKAILLNFQTPKGVVGATLNSNGVSVIPKTNSSQVQKSIVNGIKPLTLVKPPNKHPAPLPNPLSHPNIPGAKMVPPKPHLSIRKINKGIVLQWRMPYDLGLYETIISYQLYAYQETASTPNPDMWKKIGEVKAMALPMACTLTQFAENNKYYFAVRPIDVYKRIGKFSNPEEISL